MTAACLWSEPQGGAGVLRGGPGGAGQLAGMVILAELFTGPPLYSILPHFLVPGLFQPSAQGGRPGRASIIPLPWLSWRLAWHCGTGMACSARPHVLSVQKSTPRHVFSNCSHLEWHQGPFVLKGTLKMNESAPSCDSPKGQVSKWGRD